MRKFLLFISLFAHGAIADEIGLIVNNKAYSKNIILEELSYLKRVSPPQIPEQMLMEMLIQKKIENNIIEIISARAKLEVSAEEVQEALINLEQQNKLGPEEFFKKVKKETGMNEEDFIKQLKSDLLAEKIKIALFAKEINISKEQIDNQIAQLALQKDVSMQVEDLLLPLPKGTPEERAEIISQNLLTVSEALQKYQGNMEKVAQTIPGASLHNLGEININRISGRFARAFANSKIGEVNPNPVIDRDGMHFIRVNSRNDINQGYKVVAANVKHILLNGDNAEKAIFEIAEALKNGADFSRLAQSFSVDSSSAANGGDLGLISSDAVDPEFAKVMVEIPLNSYSKPFKSSFGWHILIVSNRNLIDKSDEIIRENIEKILFLEKVEEKWQEKLIDLRASAYVKRFL